MPEGSEEDGPKWFCEPAFSASAVGDEMVQTGPLEELEGTWPGTAPGSTYKRPNPVVMVLGVS